MVLKTKDPGFTRFSKIDLEMPTQYDFDENFHTPGPCGCSRSLEILNIYENFVINHNFHIKKHKWFSLKEKNSSHWKQCLKKELFINSTFFLEIFLVCNPIIKRSSWIFWAFLNNNFFGFSL